MWIKWKCEALDCNKEFIADHKVDEPSCPACGCEYAEEIGRVEVIDER